MATNDDTRAFQMFGLRILGDFGVTLAVPAVFAAWAGSKIDAAWGTRPYATFACLALAFGVTMIVVRRKAAAYGKEYQRLIDRHDHPSDRR